MNEVALLYRAAQFFAHVAHNVVIGPTFLEAHEYLGEIYGAYETAYDAVVERIIGLGGTVDLQTLTINAANQAGAMEMTNLAPQAFFSQLLAMEKGICVAIRTATTGASDGTQNLLQGLADESEMRQYKLGQLTK